VGKKEEQIKKAGELGAAAYKKGIKAPCHDAELTGMIGTRQIGEIREGEASTIELLTAWIDKWTDEHLSQIEWSEE
jgi:hypothetical protein